MGRTARIAAAALGAVLAVVAGSAGGGERLPGPIEATVVSVVDGDTLVVRARIWLGQEVETRVRLAGVDTPEMNGRCADERARARRARDLLAARLGNGRVVLREVSFGKYGGRVIAEVHTAAGEDLAATLIDAGLGRAYDGGSRAPWCGDGAAGDTARPR